jgi:hypothetical protein
LDLGVGGREVAWLKVTATTKKNRCATNNMDNGRINPKKAFK